MKCVRNRGVQGAGTLVLLAVPAAAMWGVGWVLAHVSDAVGYVVARFQ